MARITTYIIVMTGIMLLFYFTGLLSNTISSTLLDIALNPEQIQNIQFLGLTGTQLTLAALIGGSIVLGLAYFNAALVIVAPIAIYLLSLGWDFLSVFNVVAETNRFLAIILFAPLFIIWIITIIEWWRGG